MYRISKAPVIALIAIFFSMFMAACGSKYDFSPQSISQLNDNLKEKFGENAWYTSVVIRDDNGRNVITVDVTKDPNSLRQAQWVLRGEWEKSTDISVRVDGGKPEDYMFQLDKEVSLKLLSDLIEKSKQKLIETEEIQDGQTQVASIIANNEMTNKKEGIVYTISLYSPAQGKSYSLVYDIDGNELAFNK